MIRKNISLPSSGRRVGQERKHHKVGSKMEAKCTSETCVDFQRITPFYIPGDTTLHKQRRENKPCEKLLVFFCGSGSSSAEFICPEQVKFNPHSDMQFFRDHVNVIVQLAYIYFSKTVFLSAFSTKLLYA
jgi:hypothetical protein